MVLVDVVAGFLGAGKTTLIRQLLEDETIENIVVVQCEEGEEELYEVDDKKVHVLLIEDEEALNEAFFMKLQEEYKAQRVVIEYNGTWKIDTLLKVKLPRGYQIGQIVTLVAANTFHKYIQNMPAMMIEPIVESDTILISQHEKCNEKKLEELEKSIKKLNKKANYNLAPKDYHEDQQLVNHLFCNHAMHRGKKIYSGMKWICLLLAMVVALLYVKGLLATGENTKLAFIFKVHNSFVGLLLELLPFVLIGSFVASLLQVLVSENQLERLFKKHKILRFPLAIGLGVIFPVCDCSLIPIVARLTKKGVSSAYAIFFMLSAMVVNPIVLLSTYYAFPNQPEMVLYRLIMGLLMAIGVGYLFNIYKRSSQLLGPNKSGSKSSKKGKASKKDKQGQKDFFGEEKDSVLEELPVQMCSSGYMGPLRYEGKLGVAEAVMRHTTLEFMYILPLAMIGALASVIIQNSPLVQMATMPQSKWLAFVIMLVAAMTISVCGTSNAFIARGFSAIFPVGYLVGFMVLGPMLDIKNLLVMSGYYSKRFIGIYMGTVIGVGFILMTVLNLWL